MSSTSVLTPPLPGYQEFMKPILECLDDGKEHSKKQLEDYTCLKLGLDDKHKALKFSSGTGNLIIPDRVHYAIHYLKGAGCLTRHKIGNKTICQITDRGKVLLSKNLKIDNKCLGEYEDFIEFLRLKNVNRCNNRITELYCTGSKDTESSNPLNQLASEETATQLINSAYEELQSSLVDELLEKIKTEISPKQFEDLVLDVLASMGYGGGRRREFFEVTSYTNDKGIDGIIKEDALGLEQIYIQAKRYTSGSVGRPDVQNFAGSMDGPGGKKGIFITTSTFSKEAITFAEAATGKRIILIDGQKLAMLMIENGVGVSEETRYVIHKIDNDYFDAFS